MFQQYKVDAIYRSFSVSNFYDAFTSMKTLKFSGIGVAMPFKVIACEYVDRLNLTAEKCGAINTILFEEDFTVGFNTDYLAAYRMLGIYNPENRRVHILGTGGLSKAYQAACRDKKIEFVILNRLTTDSVFNLTNEIVFNCTPLKLDVRNNIYVDCLTDTPTGYEFFLYQAREQFKLYTGYEIPIT